jgi:hypothetical protein
VDRAADHAAALALGEAAAVGGLRVDDMFAFGLYFGEVYQHSRNRDYADSGSYALQSLVRRLQQEDGLFNRGGETPVLWGRGNGLAAAGFAELLLRIPKEHPRSHGTPGQDHWYKTLIADYRSQMKALLAVQDSSGGFRQVLDDSDAWIETSGTGLLVYALATGIRQGWIPADPYVEAVRRAWVALAGRVDADGRLQGVSPDLSGNSAQDYLGASPGTGTADGQAALLLAASAMILLEHSPWIPELRHATPTDYLQVVKDYAETMLHRGRDTYGIEHSPLFSVTLNRETLQLPSEEELEKLRRIRDDIKNFGYRNRDRVLKGSNPQQDEDLYQVLYALTEITGDARYAREADRTLEWFFDRCQSPATGLLAWGEHMGWDFRTETIIWKPTLHNGGILLESITHEFGKAWVLWERSFEQAPRACTAFALGLWEHQIHDHTTGTFSRHAVFTEHRTFPDSEFPRHGGFYLATWAEAFRKTEDPVFARAITTLVAHFERNRSPQSGMIPAVSPGEIAWPFSNLALAIELGEGAEKVDAALAKKMRACASRTDEIFLKLPHDLTPAGKGFAGTVDYHTLEPREVGGYTGRLNGAEVAVANNCMVRYRQSGLAGYRELVLEAALPYLTTEFDFEFAVSPGAFASTIWLLLDAHELSDDARYVERANHFARQSVELFFGDGSPLPRVNTKYGHYEAITGGDTLAMALLRLWILRNRPDLEVTLRCSGR